MLWLRYFARALESMPYGIGAMSAGLLHVQSDFGTHTLTDDLLLSLFNDSRDRYSCWLRDAGNHSTWMSMMREITTFSFVALAVALLLLSVAAAHADNQNPESMSAKDASARVPEKTTQNDKTNVADFAPYMANMQRRIKSCWRPPENSERKQVVVVFKVNKAGELSDLRLTNSSGSATTDESALEAVVKAAPFSPLPATLPEIVDIQFTFENKCSSWQQIIEDQTRVINQNQKSALAFKLRGEAYFELGRYQKARDDYSQAIKLEPGNAQLYDDRGCAWEKLGQHQQAIKDFGTAITHAQGNAMSYFYRGNSYGRWGQHRKAMEDFSRAVSLKPGDAQFHRNLGIAYDNMRLAKKGLKSLNKSINLDGKDAVAYAYRGAVYEDLCQREKAFKDYNTAVRLNQKLPADCVAIIKGVYCKNGRALADLSRFIAADPNNPVLYYIRGLHFAGCSQKWKAVADYNQALVLNPFFLEAYVERADMFSTLGKHDQAMADLTMATRIAPDNAKLFSKRGLEHAELAEWQAAIDDFTTAFKLDPVNAGYVSSCGRQTSWTSENARYFFVDKTGKPLTSQTFSDASCFSEGLAAVKIGNVYGYIDKIGNVKIKPQFALAGEFHEGLALAVPAGPGPWGFIDKSGKFVLSLEDCNIDQDSHFSEGRAPIWIGYRYGYIDRRGAIVIPPLFDRACSFSDGLANVEMGGRYGFIDKTGKLVIPPQFDLCGDFSQGLAPSVHLSKGRVVRRSQTESETSQVNSVVEGCRYGFIDKNGKNVIGCQFELPVDVRDSLVWKWSESLDKEGNPICSVCLRESVFSRATGFSEGMAPYWRGGKYGFINTAGKVVVEPQFDNIGPLSDGLALALVNGHYGFIDKAGTFVIKPQFDLAGKFSEGIAFVGMHIPVPKQRNYGKLRK